MAYYNTCPRCGAKLDPCETCDCEKEEHIMTNTQKKSAPTASIVEAQASTDAVKKQDKRNMFIVYRQALEALKHKILPPKTVSLKVYSLGIPLLNTVEGSVWYENRELYKKIKERVFEGFSEELKRVLQFAPERGQYADRARFWQRELKGKLTDAETHEALCAICKWYRRCIEMEYVSQVKTNKEFA